MLNLDKDRGAFLRALDSYKPFEIDEETFDYFLEVLPPVYMNKNVKLPDGTSVVADFGFAEGSEEVTAFYSVVSVENTLFFACKTHQMNRNG